MYDFCKTVGDQATSRTQSEWPVKASPSCLYDCAAGSNVQILIKLSEPPVTNRRLPVAPGPGALLTMLPGVVAGAQETELTPRPWAGNVTWSTLLSLNSSTLTLPSEDAQARRQPAS